MTTATKTFKPTSVIGYSVDDQILCRPCLVATTPLTGEKLTHTCRRRVYGAEYEHDLRTGNAVLRFYSEVSEKMSAALVREGWLFTPSRPGLYYSRNPNKKPPHWVTINEDASRCPACEASGSLEHGASVLPLFYGDTGVREERCTHCEKLLVDVLAAEDQARPVEVSKDRYGARRLPALHFTIRPPSVVVDELRAAGWVFNPNADRWVWYKGAPVTVPAILNLPPPPTAKAPVTARPPIVRKGAALARVAQAQA